MAVRMFKFLGLIVLVAFVSGTPVMRDPLHSPSSSPYLSGRIINGTDTTIEINPHQVSLQFAGHEEDGHWCGGSIISKNWVVTAGHCLMFESVKLEVLSGTSNLRIGGTRHAVIRTILHPNFGMNDYGISVNDIGLVRVREAFKFDKTRRPIELYEQNEITRVGSMAIVSGWGDTGDNDLSDVLQSVEIPIISKRLCNELYKDLINGIAEGQICAAWKNGGKDACQGDSGGPLTIDGRLAGVVSGGIDCAVPGHPGVYTEIAYYRNWIDKKTRS